MIIPYVMSSKKAGVQMAGVSPLGEALPAELALVALLPAVDARVPLEMRARHEREPAHVAGVRLHARVRQLVHLERRRVDERLAAQVALTTNNITITIHTFRVDRKLLN